MSLVNYCTTKTKFRRKFKTQRRESHRWLSILRVGTFQIEFGAIRVVARAVLSYDDVFLLLFSPLTFLFCVVVGGAVPVPPGVRIPHGRGQARVMAPFRTFFSQPFTTVGRPQCSREALVRKRNIQSSPGPASEMLMSGKERSPPLYQYCTLNYRQ